jgi:hypothetical protein
MVSTRDLKLQLTFPGLAGFTTEKLKDTISLLIDMNASSAVVNRELKQKLDRTDALLSTTNRQNKALKKRLPSSDYETLCATKNLLSIKLQTTEDEVRLYKLKYGRAKVVIASLTEKIESLNRDIAVRQVIPQILQVPEQSRHATNDIKIKKTQKRKLVAQPPVTNHSSQTLAATSPSQVCVMNLSSINENDTRANGISTVAQAPSAKEEPISIITPLMNPDNEPTTPVTTATFEVTDINTGALENSTSLINQMMEAESSTKKRKNNPGKPTNQPDKTAAIKPILKPVLAHTKTVSAALHRSKKDESKFMVFKPYSATHDICGSVDEANIVNGFRRVIKPHYSI